MFQFKNVIYLILILSPVFIFSQSPSETSSETTVNDYIEEAFITMLGGDNILLTQEDRDRLETQCGNESPSCSALYEKSKKDDLTKKENKKLRKQECIACIELIKDDKKIEKLTKRFPKPVDDDEGFSVSKDMIKNQTLNSLAGAILTTKTNPRSLEDPSTKNLDTWYYSGRIDIPSGDHSKFSFEYSSRKLILAELESNFEFASTFFNANNSTDVSLTKENAVNYTVLGGRFENHLIPLFDNCKYGGIDNYGDAIPLLDLWRKRIEFNNGATLYVLGKFDGVYIKKGTESKYAVNTENNFSASGGFGVGMVSFDASAKLSVEKDINQEYQMNDYDIILLGEPFYYELPTKAQIKTAWTSYSKKIIGKESDLTQTLMTNGVGVATNLTFGPILGEGNDVEMDYDYTSKKIDNKFMALVGAFETTNLGTIELNGFKTIELKINKAVAAAALEDIILSPLSGENIRVPIKLYITSGTDSLAAYYNIQLKITSTMYPMLKASHKPEADLVDGKVQYNIPFELETGNQFNPDMVGLSEITVTPTNVPLTSEIEMLNNIPRNNGEYMITFSVDPTIVNTISTVSCKFKFLKENGEVSSYAIASFKLIPYEENKAVSVSIENMANFDDVLNRLNPDVLESSVDKNNEDPDIISFDDLSNEQKFEFLKGINVIKENPFEEFYIEPGMFK
jgi:hypothetical protein